MKKTLRKALIDLAHLLDVGGKRLRSAADYLVPDKRVYLKDCEEQHWRNVQPCFVLSTGRSGTRLLNDLLLFSEETMPMHEPKPELYRPSRLAYERIAVQPEVFSEVFKSAREEYLLKSAQQEKMYIETNNQCTFFAPVIRNIFPTARFIHIVRHPGAFVRSGIRRKWYSGNHSHDIGRIIPVNGALQERWPDMSLIEKNSWLWNETNQFIENFKQSLRPEACLFVKAEDLFKHPGTTKVVYDFLGISGFQERKVVKALRNPSNPQRKGHFPPYKEWQQVDKNELKSICSLALQYGYDL